LTLLESLERSPDRSRRLWITQAYWKLAAAAARSRFAAESEDRLALIAPGGNPEDLALLDLDTASARAESASAGVELVAAQQELIDLVRLPVSDPPPWPIDIPLTAAYQTHFETIFAARPATGRVRAIHRQLPMQHAAVVARGEAVDAAERRFSALEGLHAKGSKPIGAVLHAHDSLVAQEQAFVEALRAYNLAIAEYVMAVADLSVPDDRFATMLIGQPRPWRQAPPSAPAFGAGVIPASGTLPAPPLQGAPPSRPARFPRSGSARREARRRRRSRRLGHPASRLIGDAACVVTLAGDDAAWLSLPPAPVPRQHEAPRQPVPRRFGSDRSWSIRRSSRPRWRATPTTPTGRSCASSAARACWRRR